MTLEELKKSILDNTITNKPIIFKTNGNNFLANHYIKEISKVRQLEIEYYEDLSVLSNSTWDIFFDSTMKTRSSLGVIYSEVYLWGSNSLDDLNDVILVISKFSDKEVEKALNEYIVTIPKLERWQLKDYAYSLLPGLKNEDLDTLLDLCGDDIYRLQQEMDKFLLFKESERKYLFEDFVIDGALSDLSTYDIFKLSNALTSYDLQTVKSIYRELDRIDVTDFALLVLMLKNFRNIIMVQLNANPTPENTGLEGKQLYAIKRIPRVYSQQQLTRIYTTLCELDLKVKSGDFPTSLMVDYIIMKILSFKELN